MIAAKMTEEKLKDFAAKPPKAAQAAEGEKLSGRTVNYGIALSAIGGRSATHDPEAVTRGLDGGKEIGS